MWVNMYGGGNVFANGLVLGVKFGTVYSWVKKVHQAMEMVSPPRRHRFAAVLTPILLSGYIGYVQVYDLADIRSAPLMPSFGPTRWTLHGRWGIGLDGLVSKLYDERGEPLSELVFDISNHKRVFAKYLEGT